MRFVEGYQEEGQLRDGSPVALRPIRPEDKDALRQGLARMSPHSRYLRFFTSKESLSSAELRYLTEVDGRDHFALVAGRTAEHGPGTGLGVARFIRLRDQPDVAEFALAVVDEAQGQGLGGLLLQRLAAAAAERGVHWFRCEVLAENRPMEKLLRDVGTEVRVKALGDGVMEMEIPIGPEVEQPAKSEERTPARSVLAHAAGEQISVPMGRRLLQRREQR